MKSQVESPVGLAVAVWRGASNRLYQRVQLSVVPALYHAVSFIQHKELKLVEV